MTLSKIIFPHISCAHQILFGESQRQRERPTDRESELKTDRDQDDLIRQYDH